MKEYLKLLCKREGKVVLGKHWFNLWLLTIVLFAMLISVSFSNGSLYYLSEKMNDPFTNWVDISNGYGSSKFIEFRDALQQQEVQDHYMFSDVQSDHYNSLTFYGGNGSIHFFRCRFFEHLETDLVKSILDESNVVENCAINFNQLSDQSVGFIVTKDVVKKLGYSLDSIPSYLNYLSLSVGADTLGFKMIEEKYAIAPMPLLGVVDRLPGNMDLIASSFFLEQWFNDLSHPYNLNNVEYAKSLNYYVHKNVKSFKEDVLKMIPDSLFGEVVVDTDFGILQSWKTGSLVSIYPDKKTVDVNVYNSISEQIDKKYGHNEVQRIFKYDVSDYHLNESEYISVNFSSLDSIRAFEKYAKDEFFVQIEMSQVNAKENFNDVTLMANILSWAMVIFSMICIVLFIVNMLQSYFQKVKKNIGTFKAFGISSSEMIGVYLLILIFIIFSSLVLALIFTWSVELILPCLGFLKDNEYSYLLLWNAKTMWAIGIVFLSTLLTTYWVMKRLLNRTPGDLIYDR